MACAREYSHERDGRINPERERDLEPAGRSRASPPVPMQIGDCARWCASRAFGDERGSAQAIAGVWRARSMAAAALLNAARELENELNTHRTPRVIDRLRLGTVHACKIRCTNQESLQQAPTTERLLGGASFLILEQAR
jgi:hypothetical protein